MITPDSNDTLEVAQAIADTTAEGPGRRYALWLQGCSRRCPGCCNPEMWPAGDGKREQVSCLAATIIATPGIEGLTLLGGEPFEQAAGAARLCQRLREAGLSVTIFTGFTLEQLEARGGGDRDVRALLDACDLLIDGPFLVGHPEERRRWIGSTNQQVHFLTGRYQPSDPRFLRSNSLEIRLVEGVVQINGWPVMELDRR